MPVVNYYYLHHMLGPLNTVSSAEAEEIASIDGNDEREVRAVLRQVVKPEFGKLSADSQKICKDSLRYFLTTQDAPFWKLIASHQDSMLEPPDQSVDLFLWLWRELFPDEEFFVEDLKDWFADNDSSKAGLH